MDWDKLKTLMATPASATNPDRDHELAAMVPELLDMITLKSFGFNDPQSENAKRIVSEREKPPTQLSEAPTPTPREYRMVVRDEGQSLRFDALITCRLFLWMGSVWERLNFREAKQMTAADPHIFAPGNIVQPVTISWEPA